MADSRLFREESSIQDVLDSPLKGLKLAGLKTRALRKRVWFRALDRVERGLLDLTIRWVDIVRSGRLTEVLLRILVKLARAMEHGIARVLAMGKELALNASEFAVRWGNGQAYEWRSDRGFWLGIGLGSAT